ncbi:MAG: potassium transporter TrkG [archaeon]|jgi:trk system potassium uptake protein TrkH
MFLRVGKEDIKIALKDSGTVLTYAGFSFFVPIILAILVDKNADFLLAYAVSALLVFGVGYILKTQIKTKKYTEMKHALLSIVLIWLFYCFFASLPFVFIMKASLLDAFFETMSTLTTTGLSVFTTQLDFMPASLIFWRTFLGWIGGIGIVLMALIGLMTSYSKTTKLLIAEGRGDQLKENLKTATKKITVIYIILTLIGILLLMIVGQNLWQATNYSMSVISTNGMNITTAGLTTVNNGFVMTGVHNYFTDIVLVFIMFMGATSFSLHYLFIRKKNWLVYFKDPEFRLLLLIGLVGTIIVGTKIGIWNSFFHTFSMATCGGIAFLPTEIIAGWSDFTKLFLVVVVIIGGATGSTAGGIKLSRAIIFVKGIYWKIKKSILPDQSYFRQQYNGEQVLPEQLREINQFILMWIIFIAIGTLVITSYGFALSDALFEVASAQSNAGLSTGISGSGMPVGVEVMLIINMFVGRLEIIPIIASVGLLLNLRRRK